jgi:hypothetical protein
MVKVHAFIICMAIQDIGVMESDLKLDVPPTIR